MIANTKKGENCCYAICYWFMSELIGKEFFPRAEEAAETAIRYLACHLPKEEVLSYISAYGLHKSKFWESLKDESDGS